MFLKNCPTCNSGQVKRVEDTVERKIHRKVIRIPKVTYWICENCGEKIFFPDSLKRMRAELEKHAELESERLPAA